MNIIFLPLANDIKEEKQKKRTNIVLKETEKISNFNFAIIFSNYSKSFGKMARCNFAYSNCMLYGKRKIRINNFVNYISSTYTR